LQLLVGKEVNNMAKQPEFWRWTESRWTNPGIDHKGKVMTSGVDVGSVSSQAVILADGELYAYSNMRTGSNSPDSAKKAMDWAMEDTGLALKDLSYTVGTGYGRVNVPFSQRAITEIACHARGGNYMYGPTVRTILDMGGQDCKAIHCDERGKVTNFLMNDKCAAGTGRGMEVFADLLGVSINDVGDLSFDIDKEPQPVSSTCVVYAKTEATGLLREGWPKNKVLAAYCSAMAHRIMTLLERIGVEEDFAITGGISKNKGVVKRLEKEVGIKIMETSKYDPQIAGALGAALFAKALYDKGKK
jgi:bzd-type benzoyl-CoA reductase Q subunit